MHQRAMNIPERRILPQTKSKINKYSSVEISHQDINFCYHFKLRNMPPMDLCILVREDSDILPRLKEGFTFDMKYYGSNPFDPAENRKTAVRHVIKDSQGRYKGHYLVQLELVDQ